MRPPAQNATLIVVNTARYGGCGGSGAVYAAGNSAATDIASHDNATVTVAVSLYEYWRSSGFTPVELADPMEGQPGQQLFSRAICGRNYAT